MRSRCPRCAMRTSTSTQVRSRSSASAKAALPDLREPVLLEHLLEPLPAQVALQREVVARRAVHGLDHAGGVHRQGAGVEVVHHRFQELIRAGEPGHQPLVLDRQVVVLDGLLHHLLEMVGLPGLRDVGVDVSVVDRLDDRAHVGEAGQDHAHRRGMALPDLGHELDAAHVGHPLVGEHDGDRGLLVEQVERAARVARGEHLVVVLEGEGHRLEDGFLVVDDQDPGQTAHLRLARARRGRAAHHPKERPDFLFAASLASRSSISARTRRRSASRRWRRRSLARARPGPLLGRIAQLAEAAIAPELVLELLFDELDHDRVVEEAQARNLVRDQVLRVREVREAGQHLRLHRCGAA